MASLIEERSDAGAISDAGVEQAIDYTERRAGLKGRDPGKLPTAQQSVSQPFIGEERKIIDVADVQDLALVEIRTGAGQSKVVRVHEIVVITVRRVVERVTPGVCQVEAQPAHMAMDRDLESVVNRVGLRFQGGNGTVPRIGAVGVRIAAARDRELVARGAGRPHSIHRAAVAISRGYG